LQLLREFLHLVVVLSACCCFLWLCDLSFATHSLNARTNNYTHTPPPPTHTPHTHTHTQSSLNYKYTVAVILEYIRSLSFHRISPQHWIHELLIDYLVRNGRFYQLHQLLQVGGGRGGCRGVHSVFSRRRGVHSLHSLSPCNQLRPPSLTVIHTLTHPHLQYHVVTDSVPVACQLLSLERDYPPAFQLALDMLKRLFSPAQIVEVLLTRGDVRANVLRKVLERIE
jgi:Regulator of MON1-CCZ1 complex, C-terminal